MSERPGAGWAEAIFRIALGAYPSRWRERYADEVTRVFQERLDDARAVGPGATIRQLTAELLGVVAAGLLVRLRGAEAAAAVGRPGGSPLRDLALDLRFAVRSLRRAPTFSMGAALVLSVGIGANVVIFTVVNAYFFRPLPFAGPDRLVVLYETNPEFGWVDAAAAPANVLDWREQVAAFEDVAAYSEFGGRVAASTGEEPVALSAVQVTGNFFSVLGVPPALGRTLSWEETWAGADRAAVVLSHRAWVTYFGQDSAAVGRTFTFGDRSAEVVGVMPAGFEFPGPDTEAWYPLGFDPASRAAVSFRRAHWLRPVARLAGGVTREEADRQLQAVVQRLQREYPETNRVMGAGLEPLRDFFVRGVRGPLLTLSAAGALLLLLACANVANLTLLRSGEREREIALRRSLGAGRARVLRQLLAENGTLALLGGAAGLALGGVGVRGLGSLTKLGIAGATAATLDARVVLFVAALTGASAVLFGLAPALRSTRSERHLLAESGRGASAGRRRLGTVRGLVVAEVALAVLLVGGAGLVTRSFLLMRDVDPGFRTEGVLAVQLSAPSSRYPTRDEVLVFQERLLAALEARPGIERAGLVEHLPLAGTSWSSQFQAEGWPSERVGFEILHRRADAGYFEALGTPLIRGRMFGAEDGPDDEPVVLINETLAREHFPGEDPVGQRVAFVRAATAESRWYRIVGVVADQSQVSPAQPPRAEVFEHRLQDWGRGGWLVLRTSGAPTPFAETVREVLREIDPAIPLTRVRALDEVWRTSMEREQFILTLLSSFGVLALVLATVGVYGVVAQATRGRTREIGIRVALGAESRQVRGLVLAQGLALAGAGVGIGVVALLGVGRLLGRLLYGVAPGDPVTLAGVAILLLATALLASWIPARRATRVDLVRSLSSE